MKFTDKLDYLMKRQGLTRGKLADMTGIPYNTIVGFYKSGYKNIKLSNLMKIAGFFDLPLDVLASDDIGLEEYFEERQSAVIEEKYRGLSQKGQRLVDNMIDGLLDMQSPEQAEGEEQAEEKIIYLREYVTPAAAGYASPAEGEDYRTVGCPQSEVPNGTDFAVRIAGDSMEPYIKDGSRVFVSRTNEIKDGDVGIFFVDGDMKCKQFCEDNYGNIYLFSLNRARADADMSILSTSGITVFCFGKVLLGRRPPLPRTI